jgi:hypothetical protein
LVSESGVEILHYCTVIDRFEEKRRISGVEIFCRGLHRATGSIFFMMRWFPGMSTGGDDTNVAVLGLL